MPLKIGQAYGVRIYQVGTAVSVDRRRRQRGRWRRRVSRRHCLPSRLRESPPSSPRKCLPSHRESSPSPTLPTCICARRIHRRARGRTRICEIRRAAHGRWPLRRPPLSLSFSENGSTLVCHVDRSETHVISAIIHIDHELDEPWPLEIEDHDGNWHAVDLQPGERSIAAARSRRQDGYARDRSFAFAVGGVTRRHRLDCCVVCSLRHGVGVVGSEVRSYVRMARRVVIARFGSLAG